MIGGVWRRLISELDIDKSYLSINNQAEHSLEINILSRVAPLIVHWVPQKDCHNIKQSFLST